MKEEIMRRSLLIAGALMMWHGAGSVMAEEMILEGEGVKAMLQEGRLVDIEVGGRVIIQEFGRVYVNYKGKRKNGLELEQFVETTKESKERGDRFVMSEGIMLEKGKRFLGEFGRVWAERKDGSLELTLHPTYFQGRDIPDELKPYHMDVSATLDNKIWNKAMLEVDGKTISPSEVKEYPVNATRILLPVNGREYLCMKPLNMPNSFIAEEAGDDVHLWFSDQEARTTWYILTDCPSCRISLSIVEGAPK